MYKNFFCTFKLFWGPKLVNTKPRQKKLYEDDFIFISEVPCADPGTPVNIGSTAVNGSSDEAGLAYTYTCHANATVHIAGSKVITCDRYGEWSGKPLVCAGICILISCSLESIDS